MDAIVSYLERHQKFFDKFAKNIYLVAIKDGFLSNMPIVLSSSLFLLLSTLPAYVGIELPQDVLDFFNKFYTYTMGVLGIMVAGTTARSLTGSINRRMPAGKVISDTSTMVTAMCGMLLLSVTGATAAIDGVDTSVFDTTYMGTKGLIAAFASAFITVNVFKVCIKHDITIKMPKEVPGTIAQSFRDIFAFSFSVLICLVIDVVVRKTLQVPFASFVSTVLSPLFSAVDTYPGIALIESCVALFQFMGIHGSSVVMQPLNVALYDNTAINLATYQAGGHPNIALTGDFTNFFGGLGGSGVTFVVPFILMFLMHSKQLKAVGRASVVPVVFGVNEPVLFGMPIVLNPYLFVPYLVAPAANAVITKLFIDFIGMNAPMYNLPWALPGPIGAFLTTGMQPISLVCIAVLLAVDFVIYYPFCKAYDAVCLKQEAERLGSEGETIAPGDSEEQRAKLAATVEKVKESDEGLKVLVLCQGGGTSALLANAIKDGAAAKGIDIIANAAAYGNHWDIMSAYNVVVLAPQVRTYEDEVKAKASEQGITVLTTRGKQYIDLSNNPEEAVDWLFEGIEA